MKDGPPRRSFFIGRWQPLHEGHEHLIRTALDEGREVVIGVMDTPTSTRNPLSMAARWQMFKAVFGPEMAAGKLQLIPMPWIDDVCYGRDCGWTTRRIRLSPELERVTATEIRTQLHVQADSGLNRADSENLRVRSPKANDCA